MKYVIYLIVLFVLFSLNLGLFDNLEIKNQIPNLLFLFSILFALDADSHDFYFISLVSGLLLDFFSTGFFGAYTLAMILVSFFAYLFTNKITVMEFKLKNLIIFLAVSLALFQLVVWFFNFIVFKFNFAPIYTDFSIYLSSFLVIYLYNLLFLYPVFLLYSFVKNFVTNLNIKQRGIIR